MWNEETAADGEQGFLNYKYTHRPTHEKTHKHPDTRIRTYRNTITHKRHTDNAYIHAHTQVITHTYTHADIHVHKTHIGIQA